jgi:putative ABC transport system permease protein
LFLETVLGDLRLAARGLRANPGFAAAAILSLALSIGGVTAVCSAFNDFLLRPLPFRAPDRLVTVTQRNTEHADELVTGVTSPANYRDWAAQNRVFETMGAWDTMRDQFDITGTDNPERVRAKRVSSSFFAVLGVGAAIGRTLGPEHDVDGGDTAAVLSAGFWQRRFAGRSDIVGQTIQVDGKPLTIVGVMPATFRFSVPEDDLWIPLAGLLDGGRSGRHLKVIARLRSGVSIDRAQTEMAVIAGRLAHAYPSDNRGETARVDPLRDRYAGAIRPALLALLGAIGLVLLVACANFASLLLARVSARQREMAIRSALGATTGRVMRQLFTESALVACLGGAAGCLLAVWGIHVLYAALPIQWQPLQAAGMDWTVLGVAFIVSSITGLLAGLGPARLASFGNLVTDLKDGSRASPVLTGRLRGSLIVGEVALSVVLVAGTGLLLRSFVRLMDVDLGIQPEHVLTMKIARTGNTASFYQDLVERLQHLPGVRAAGVTNFLPIDSTSWGQDIYIEGRPPRAPGDLIWVDHRSVTVGYFRAVGIRLLAGRLLTDDDRWKPRAVVNEEMARRYWPGEVAVGRRFKIGRNSREWITIIGVVSDVKQAGIEADVTPEAYFNEVTSQMVAVLRADVALASLVPAVRAVVRAIDRRQAVSDIRPMDSIVSDSVAPRRVTLVLAALFAGLGVVLASIGLYGLISYSFAQRTREIGIRMALGSTRTDVLWFVLKSGLGLALTGIVIGIGITIAVTPMLRSLLFRVEETDTITIAAASLILFVVSALACVLPARRAAAIDPLAAIRYE